jgi:hypothetical protein
MSTPLAIAAVAALTLASELHRRRGYTGSAWLWSKAEPVQTARAQIVEVMPTARALYGKYRLRDVSSGAELEVDATRIPGIRRGRVLPTGTVLSYEYRGTDGAGRPQSVRVLGAELGDKAHLYA